MSTTRQKIIEKTSDLLELQGYHATGLNQIVKESNTPRGSLYYYFPEGKEELATEAVQYKMQQIHVYTQAIMHQHKDPSVAINELIQSLARTFVDGECLRGAPIAAVALEASNTSERIREACHLGYQTIEQVLADKLVNSQFSVDRAARLATLILSAIEGAIVLSRAEKDPRAILAIGEEIKLWLTHTPKS